MWVLLYDPGTTKNHRLFGQSDTGRPADREKMLVERRISNRVSLKGLLAESPPTLTNCSIFDGYQRSWVCQDKWPAGVDEYLAHNAGSPAYPVSAILGNHDVVGNGARVTLVPATLPQPRPNWLPSWWLILLLPLAA